MERHGSIYRTHAAFLALLPTWAWKPDLMGATDRPDQKTKENAESQPRTLTRGPADGETVLRLGEERKGKGTDEIRTTGSS